MQIAVYPWFESGYVVITLLGMVLFNLVKFESGHLCFVFLKGGGGGGVNLNYRSRAVAKGLLRTTFYTKCSN